MQEEQQQEKPVSEQAAKQPLNHLFRPETVFTLTPQEMSILSNLLQPFEWALAVLNNSKNAAATQGFTVPVFKEDVNEKGELKNPTEFWKKHAPKETAPVILDSNGVPANKN